MAVLELLADLLPLRQTYANQAEEPPTALIGAVERMLPALRFFRHQDGSLARFNGMGATIHDRIAAILRHDDTAGAPLQHAPHSGYERLSMGGTTVIADTGLPPHADVSEPRACRLPVVRDVVRPPQLHREFRRRHVRRAGVPAAGPRHRRAFDGDAQRHLVGALQQFDRRQRIDRRAAGVGTQAGGVRAPATARTRKASSPCMTAMSRVSASITSARCRCRRGGNELTGIDRFFLAGGKPARNNGRDFVAVRFHVHPEINLFTDKEDRLVLTANGTDAWVFSASVEPMVEDSIFFAGLSGPRKSRQIVLAFKASEVQEVRWEMTRTRLAEQPNRDSDRLC